MSHPAITTLAGLTFRKGIDVLLDAFEIVHRAVPKAQLYIIGQGPDREAFLAQAATLEAREQIHFLGFQPDPRPYLARTEIFVLASRREPFGLVIVEARAAGCAIVASDVDGIPEALDGRRCGLLVPPGDPGQLATALVSLLTDEAALAYWKRVALEGLEKYDVARLHRETLAAYALA
jgi:glycosyltransferase involved in cell wall biosynthesis